MRTLWQDVKYGLRMLGKNPGFTVVAVATLALGIGANTAIFSVVNAVLLEPLPYEKPDELVRVFGKWTNYERGSVSEPEYGDYKTSGMFATVAAHSSVASTVIQVGAGEPERVPRTMATTELFSVLGVRAALGRAFVDEDLLPGAANVALISDGLWRRRFGGDAGVLKRTIQLNGWPCTIVGVMPAGFDYPSKEVQVWIPLGRNFAPGDPQARRARYLRVVGRRKAGITLEQTQAQMSVLAAEMAKEYPAEYPEGSGWGIAVEAVREVVVGDVEPALLVLLGAVGFVLLIACANVGNLMLARATGQGRELAVRAALGASRGRLVRQMVTESLLLSGAGGMVAVLVAYWGLGAVLAMSPGDIPRLEEVTISGTVLGYAAGISVLTGILFGLVPAWRAAKADVNEALKASGRGSVRTGHRKTQRTLVVSEVALAVVLLVGAGLLIRSFANLTRTDLGFDAAGVATAKVRLVASQYSDPQKITGYYARLHQELEAIPGVEAAGVIENPPLSGWYDDQSFGIEGKPPAVEGLNPNAETRYISPGFFKTLRIPLLRGRDFSAHDDLKGELVGIVSESLAARDWGGEDAVGKRIRLGGLDAGGEWITIVGIAGDIRHGGAGEPMRPTLYMPMLQNSDTIAYPTVVSTVLVRAQGDARALLPLVRERVRSVDAAQPIFDVKLMEEFVRESRAQARFNLALLGIFAALAVGLAAVGIYGVMRYVVGQRASEMGLRMALGAQRGQVLGMVLREGLGLAVAGLGIGLAGAVVLGRVLRGVSSLLHGVQVLDVVTLVGVTLLLVGVAAGACLVPAWKAARVDPMEALRYE